MKQVDTLISARWVLTVEDNQPLEHHSVAIHEGKIVDILPSSTAHDQYTAKEHHQLNDHMLMPGFVNLHGHAPMTLFRGLADDLPLMTWLNDHIWPAEGQCMSPDFVADGTELAAAEMIRSGTTAYCDHYFFCESSAETADRLGLRARFYPCTLEFPTPHGSCASDYLKKNEALFKRYESNSLISVGFGPHAPYTVNDDSFREMVQMAKGLGASIQIHLHETAHEVNESLEKFKKRPSERLAELGVFDCAPFQAVHVTQVEDVDIELFKAHNVFVVHCPESNLKLASGFCPVDRLQKAGVSVCLGTDGAASNNDLDMLGEMRTAAMLAKAVGNNAEALPAFEAIKMATLTGARALGLEDKIGSIKAGKEADLIAIDFSQIESQPLYDPVSHLVYCTTADKVSHTWIQGNLKMANRVLTDIDSEALKAKVSNWRSKVLNRA